MGNHRQRKTRWILANDNSAVAYKPLPYLLDDMLLTRNTCSARPFQTLGQAVPPRFPTVAELLSNLHGDQYEPGTELDQEMERLNALPCVDEAL